MLTQVPEMGALESGGAPDTRERLSWHQHRQAEDGWGGSRNMGASGEAASGDAGTTQLLQGVNCQGSRETVQECCFLALFLFYFILSWEGLYDFQLLSARFHRAEMFSRCVSESLHFR